MEAEEEEVEAKVIHEAEAEVKNDQKGDGTEQGREDGVVGTMLRENVHCTKQVTLLFWLIPK